MDAAERALFVGSIERAVTGMSGRALDASLLALGWTDALSEDPHCAVSVLFEAQGRHDVTSSALDWLLATALGQGDAAVVLPMFRGTDPPGVMEGDGVSVHGLGTTTIASTGRAVVVRTEGSGHVAGQVPVARLTVRSIKGIDPALGLVDISGTIDVAEGGPWVPVDWSHALARGQLALSHQLVGAGRAMLELARTHALERVQFGRPIGAFQAVRHRLAEAFVAVEAADALLEAAWDNPSPEIAAMAKGLAGRNARSAARHCQQVLAGIGFTREHRLHRFIARAIVLDQLLGAGSVLTRTLGATMIEQRRCPATLPL